MHPSMDLEVMRRRRLDVWGVARAHRVHQLHARCTFGGSPSSRQLPKCNACGIAEDIFQITPSVTQRQGEKSVKNDPGYDVGVNLRIEFGWTPLLVAADYGRTESLKILLEHGADPFQTLEGNLSSDKCIAIFAALYIKN